MATANEQNAFLSDLNHGPTAILAASTASLSIGDPRVKETYDTFSPIGRRFGRESSSG
jgi:hypothetical protein